MSRASRAVVLTVFTILGLSFLAVFASLVYEYRDADWQSLAALYSQLFIFFPAFGIAALIAFYFPAVVFLDMYWNHVPMGRTRLIIGWIGLALLSFLLAQQLLQGVPAIWQIKPEVLKADQGEPAGCAKGQQTCVRLPILKAVSLVREESKKRFGMAAFGRDCSPDTLLPPPETFSERRFCFASGQMATGEECCRAQTNFGKAIERLYERVDNRALTGKVHEWVLPFLVFFLLVLFVIGAMLVVRREALDKYYPEQMSRIERGVLVGAFAMMFWPLSNHAYIQSSAVLFGNWSRSLFISLAPGFSILFGAWTLMLLFFFFRRYEQDMEVVGKITGVVASAIAILQYKELIGYFERFAGSGAGPISLGIIGVVLVAAILHLCFWSGRSASK